MRNLDCSTVNRLEAEWAKIEPNHRSKQWSNQNGKQCTYA